MKPRLVAVFLLLAPFGAVAAIAASQTQAPAQPQATPTPQVVVDARRLFESGKDQDVIRAVQAATSATPDARAQLTYLAGQSNQRLRQDAQAKQAYSQLAARPATDPWSFIGQSAVAVVDRRYDAAVTAATRATTMAPRLPEAHFQLGVAKAFKQDFTGAASSFVQATTIDPSFAHAHYNAALSFNRLRRTDQVAVHFTAFLRLAPQAPERPMVESIMRTIRR